MDVPCINGKEWWLNYPWTYSTGQVPGAHKVSAYLSFSSGAFVSGVGVGGFASLHAPRIPRIPRIPQVPDLLTYHLHVEVPTVR